MNNNFLSTINQIFEGHSSSLRLHFDKNEMILETELDMLEKTLFFLRDHEGCLFKILIDILVVDHPSRKKKVLINILFT